MPSAANACDRAPVAGLDLGDLRVRVGGGLRIAEAIGGEVGVRHAQARGLARVVAERVDRFEVRDAERREVAGRLRERLELVLDQLIARRERERAREVGERAGGVVLVLEAQLRGFAEQRELGAIVVRLGEARRATDRARR